MRIFALVLFFSSLTLLMSGKLFAGGEPAFDHEKVGGLLVNSDGGMVKKALKNKCILVYFASRSSAPCRDFTPKLIKYYDENRKGDHFVVILFSLDEDKTDMQQNMKEARMPWPAVKYDKRQESNLRPYCSESIPCLALIDEEGDMVGNGIANDQYMGPEYVLKQLTNRLDDFKKEDAKKEEKSKKSKKKSKKKSRKRKKKKSTKDD